MTELKEIVMALQENNLVDLGSPTPRRPVSPYPGARDFEPLHLYTKDTIIFQDNLLYRARYNFTSDEVFELQDWEQIAINSVAWSEIAGDITQQADLQNALNEINDSISTEIQERQEADTAIENNLNTAITQEANTRAQADTDIHMELNSQAQTFQQAINNEETARTAADLALSGDIEILQNDMAGVNAVELQGDLLTREINGTTPVAKNLFDPDTVFVENKTLINDADGTIGKYIGDVDSATINVQTLSISPISTNEPRLLATVNTYADLPLTVADAEALGWNTPRVDDYAQVRVDETNNNNRVEWYISEIDGDGNITWGNPVVLNTSDFQEQTTALDAGMVLTGGDRPGTFGMPLGVDTEPTAGSSNLVSSNAVAQADEELQANIDSEEQARQEADTNLLAQINQLISKIIYPIGSYYTQYAGNNNAFANAENPATLFGGTWSIMWNTEGMYFQTEGGGSMARTNGVQQDAIRNITGKIEGLDTSSNVQFLTDATQINAEGALFITEKINRYTIANTTSLDSIPKGIGFDASKIVTTDIINHPKNRLIRVWKRTA